jgi:hypothetical protein
VTATKSAARGRKPGKAHTALAQLRAWGLKKLRKAALRSDATGD